MTNLGNYDILGEISQVLGSKISV